MLAKQHVYIAQFVGILVLLVSYLLSNQPDNLSLMHFNARASSSYILSSRVQEVRPTATTGFETAGHENTNGHKYSSGRFFFASFLLPDGHLVPMNYRGGAAAYVDGLAHPYDFLYFKEINPPPPPRC